MSPKFSSSHTLRSRFSRQTLRATTTLLLAALSTVYVRPVYACDLCSLYTDLSRQKPNSGRLNLSVAEQFTYQGKIQEDGSYVPNEEHQHLASSITQVVGSYAIDDSWSFQTLVPFISRRYKRVEGDGVQTGNETGIGDTTFLAQYFIAPIENDSTAVFLRFFGGLKIPTGDAGPLSEEQDEEHHSDGGVDDDHSDEGEMPDDDHNHEGTSHDHASSFFRPAHGGVTHGGTPSAIHGHDIALGSGSFDFPLGVTVLAEYDRTFMRAMLQYIFRTEGKYDYRYANDLQWSGGPGYYLVLDHDFTVSATALMSGEYKGNDKLGGESEPDTSINSFFMGPQISVATEKLRMELGYDLPIRIENSGYQTVPQYRLRAALTYYF